MKDGKIQVAVIGCGNRSCTVVGNLLKDSRHEVEIAAVYDPDRSECCHSLQEWDVIHAEITSGPEEAIRFPGVDWVMIFSPNAFHKEHILAAFAAKKNVFSEKPLATSIEDCQEIYQTWLQSGVIFATGFVLRYGPIYRKVKELLDSGKFGRLLAIDGSEHITSTHGGYIMRNWRRHTKIAGPHILEKCCHDLDLINWFCGSLPSRVASFGGRMFFTSENRFLEQKYGDSAFYTWRDPKAVKSAFDDDTDLMDTQISIAEYRNGIKVSFSSSMANAVPERRLFFHCTEGSVIVELYQKTLLYRRLGEEAYSVLNIKTDGHGGGDAVIMKELFDTMKNGTEPKCGGSEGLESAVFALALDQAAVTGKVVDLEPVWKKLER